MTDIAPVSGQTEGTQQFDVRYHGAMPGWVKVVGLSIKIIDECEGGGFAVREDHWRAILGQGSDNARLRAENERLTRTMIEWRSAFQDITPGGSEFMSPDSVREYARDFKRRGVEARLEVAKQSKELSVLRATVETLREAIMIVRRIVAGWAPSGFNHNEADWAMQLYRSQADTKAAIEKADAIMPRAALNKADAEGRE